MVMADAGEPLWKMFKVCVPLSFFSLAPASLSLIIANRFIVVIDSLFSLLFGVERLSSRASLPHLQSHAHTHTHTNSQTHSHWNAASAAARAGEASGRLPSAVDRKAGRLRVGRRRGCVRVRAPGPAQQQHPDPEDEQQVRDVLSERQALPNGMLWSHGIHHRQHILTLQDQ